MARRGRNEGTIYQMKNGRWRAQISVEGKRLSYVAETRRECYEWMQKTQAQIEEGLTYDSAKTTFREFLLNWLKNKETALAKKTIIQYRQVADSHILPALGRLKFKDLSSGIIQRFYDKMQDEGHRPRSIHIIHAVVHGSLGQAVRLGLLSSNPSDAVILPKVAGKELQTWDESQVSQFLVFISGHRNEHLYYLAIHTGMRMGEILGLQWEDIDFVQKTLKVVRQVSTAGRGWEFVSPKTKSGIRTVDLGNMAIERLRDQIEKVDMLRTFAGDKWQEHDLIFPSTVGTPQGKSNLAKEFHNLSEAAGVPRIRFHDLRHTAAALMLSHGVPTILVSKRLGHSKPSITMDVYGHLVPGLGAGATQLMDELINPVEVDITG